MTITSRTKKPDHYEPEQIDDGTQRPEIGLDGAPASQEERQDPPVRDIIAEERAQREARNAMTDGHRVTYAQAVARKQDAAATVAHYSRDPAASDQHTAAAQKALNKATTAAAALLLTQKAQLEKLPADAMAIIEAFLANAARISNGRGFRCVGTDEPVLPGKDEAASAKPIEAQIQRVKADIDALDSAPMNTAEFEAQTRRKVQHMSAAAKSNIRSAARVYFDEGRWGHYVPGSKANGRYANHGVEVPTVAYVTGTGDLRYLADGVAFMGAIAEDDVVASIVAQAADYHAPDGLTLAERQAERVKLDERLLELERRHESLRRKARANGVHFARVSSNPFAVLDVAIR